MVATHPSVALSPHAAAPKSTGRPTRWGMVMSGVLASSWSPALGGPDQAMSWENIYDDGFRADHLPYLSDLLRLDECGPAATTNSFVL